MLILASGSPRRKQLLKSAQFNFRTDPIKISEIVNENLSLRDLLMDLAYQKAQGYIKTCNLLKLHGKIILTADTMVIFEGQPLGKPVSSAQAEEFLLKLSGKTHSVMTGICIFEPEKNIWALDVDETKVEFKELSNEEIKNYIQTGEPMDKAGAYGIQGLGAKFVKSTTGSWTNVVGLPMELLTRILNERGWDVGQKKLG